LLRALRVFDDRVMRKTEQVTGGWRKQHSEEIHDSYYSPNITQLTTERRVRYGGNVVRMGERRDAQRILVGKHEEGKRPHRTSTRRSEDKTGNVRIT
jgi:hypothetical protein